jgi:predicted NAD/FAD-dependent oxidoreductase
MIHRWRYANCETNHHKFSQIDSEYQIAVCADWTSTCRVEHSFLNAYQLKDALFSAMGLSEFED